MTDQAAARAVRWQVAALADSVGQSQHPAFLARSTAASPFNRTHLIPALR
jgi:hypothetical protein